MIKWQQSACQIQLYRNFRLGFSRVPLVFMCVFIYLNISLDSFTITSNAGSVRTSRKNHSNQCNYMNITNLIVSNAIFTSSDTTILSYHNRQQQHRPYRWLWSNYFHFRIVRYDFLGLAWIVSLHFGRFCFSNPTMLSYGRRVRSNIMNRQMSYEKNNQAEGERLC